jgi:HD superfamily phosphodiesterase/predicted RNA-binding Zn-ribbon protein involved in translation (DUF1610 family)
MTFNKCPGSQFVRQPAPELFTCQVCKAEVEIWTDEIRARCPHCGQMVYRDPSMSCIEWCRYAEECVGTEVYSKIKENRLISIKRKLLKELEDYFGKDKKRINHAKKVLEYTELLLKKLKADAHIVIPAAILHDVGIKIAEEKYGSNAGTYQEKEGPPVARKILLKLGIKKEDIDEICDIIGHHHSPGKNETLNFRILYDADGIVNLEEIAENKRGKALQRIIEKHFLTDEGRQCAKILYAAAAGKEGERP